jgi:hypothetical protein
VDLAFHPSISRMAAMVVATLTSSLPVLANSEAAVSVRAAD